MTYIKLCGLTRPEDIRWANDLRPDAIGFVFAPGSRRRVTPEQARTLRELVAPRIRVVGVFLNAPVEQIAGLLKEGVIDMAQLHGSEDDPYIRRLRAFTRKPILQAVPIRTPADALRAQNSISDLVLLDSGSGSGKTFDWTLLQNVQRPYFLAGGLNPENVGPAVRRLRPYGVDVSSGIETNGVKDPEKMAAFVAAVRKEE